MMKYLFGQNYKKKMKKCFLGTCMLMYSADSYLQLQSSLFLIISILSYTILKKEKSMMCFETVAYSGANCTNFFVFF